MVINVVSILRDLAFVSLRRCSVLQGDGKVEAQASLAKGVLSLKLQQKLIKERRNIEFEDGYEELIDSSRYD